MAKGDLAEVLLEGARSEELAFGPSHDGRRWPWVVLILVVVIAAVGAGVDARRRTDEAAELLGGIEQSQSTMTYAERSVVATVTYASPALVLSKTPGAVRQDLVQLVEEAVAKGAGSVRAVRSDVAGMTFWPWHDDLEAARTAYLAYLDHRLARLEVRQASTESYEHSQLLLRVARDELRSAVEAEDGERIDRLLASGQGR
jgi:hypothetical protein